MNELHFIRNRNLYQSFYERSNIRCNHLIPEDYFIILKKKGYAFENFRDKRDSSPLAHPSYSDPNASACIIILCSYVRIYFGMLDINSKIIKFSGSTFDMRKTPYF